MKRIVIGNLKMYITSRDLWDTYLSQLRGVGTILAPDDQPSFVICPSMMHIAEMVRVCADLQLSCGVQDVHWESHGAYTSATSPMAVAEMGVRYAIIGHSERRTEGESQETVIRKTLAAISAGLVPIVCVGFTYGDDEVSAVIDQVATIVQSCGEDSAKVIFAYEPVWAIGTGQTPTGAHVQMMRLCIERTIEKLSHVTQSCILYGGSVTSQNAEALCREGAVDGFLVGGASRDPGELMQIYRIINK